jgi:hypothetical protein
MYGIVVSVLSLSYFDIWAKSLAQRWSGRYDVGEAPVPLLFSDGRLEP